MLINKIESAILNHPRSQQVKLGPSEAGTPCSRKLGYKLAQFPPVRKPTANWKATVGTAVHAWLEEVFSEDSDFITEKRVQPGFIDGEVFDGCADLYHKKSYTVIDFKVCGPNSMKHHARRTAEQYNIQRALYGYGYENAGYRVENVALLILPSAGDLRDHIWDSTPYNPQIAIDAIDKADRIARAGRVAGWDNVIPKLKMADDFCQSCPFQRSDADSWEEGCPGVGVSSGFDGLI